MRARSIRTRLTLWYTSLLTCTLLVIGGAAYGLLSYNLSREMDGALSSIGMALGERAHSRSATFFPSDINEVFRRFFGFSPWEPYFQILDPLGQRDPRQPTTPSGRLPLSEEARNNASRGISTLETIEGLGKHPVRVLTVPVVEAGRPISFIQVGMSLQSANEARLRFLLVMAAVLPLGLMLAATGGWLLADRALKPVDRMTSAARRITAEHLTERVEETGAGDELDRLARTLNAMLARLDAAFSQVRQFSADASHELQTPLTILKGELELALRSPRSVDEYQTAIRSALEEVDRIAQLVEGLLLLARAESGMLKMDRRPVDLRDLVADVHGRLKGVAETRSVEFRVEARESAVVHGDPERLRRLLLNLLENAIKYTKPDGLVSLSLHREGDRAVIRVSDSGMGIADQEVERIFEPFYRTAEARSMVERGTGLGLSIARSIALAHGGTVQVESIPGKGSTFTARFPINA